MSDVAFVSAVIKLDGVLEEKMMFDNKQINKLYFVLTVIFGKEITNSLL